MFVLLLSYQAPLEEVDRHLAAHRAFLEHHYAAGRFLVSGRQVPRSGGVILADVPSREDAERIASEDPFSRHGVASYTITEFTPTMWDPRFAACLG